MTAHRTADDSNFRTGPALCGGHSPASISLALAVFWLTSTVSGACVNAGAVATIALPLDACRPSVTRTRAPAAHQGLLGRCGGKAVHVSLSLTCWGHVVHARGLTALHRQEIHSSERSSTHHHAGKETQKTVNKEEVGIETVSTSLRRGLKFARTVQEQPCDLNAF